MYGCVDFYKAAKKARRQAHHRLRGVCRHTHAFRQGEPHRSAPTIWCCLCKNETGYKNLIKMVSAGFTEGFYNKPRVDHALLEEYHEGLICLFRLPGGRNPAGCYWQGDYEEAKNLARYYARSVWQRQTIILRYRTIGLDEQRTVLPVLVRLSQETGIPLVATNDAHYLEQRRFQDAAYSHLHPDEQDGE